MYSKAESKILVVDDNAEIVSQIVEILAKDGYKVGFTLNAKDGLKVLDTIDYDLIILDINMPRMNGFDFLLELKSNKRHKLIPVLMNTAEADKSSVVKAIKLGADDYIIKPINKKVLLEKVADLFKIRNFVKRWGVLAK